MSQEGEPPKQSEKADDKTEGIDGENKGEKRARQEGDSPKQPAKDDGKAEEKGKNNTGEPPTKPTRKSHMTRFVCAIVILGVVIICLRELCVGITSTANIINSTRTINEHLEKILKVRSDYYKFTSDQEQLANQIIQYMDDAKISQKDAVDLKKMRLLLINATQSPSKFIQDNIDAINSRNYFYGRCFCRNTYHCMPFPKHPISFKIPNAISKLQDSELNKVYIDGKFELGLEKAILLAQLSHDYMHGTLRSAIIILTNADEIPELTMWDRFFPTHFFYYDMPRVEIALNTDIFRSFIEADLLPDPVKENATLKEEEEYAEEKKKADGEIEILMKRGKFSYYEVLELIQKSKEKSKEQRKRLLQQSAFDADFLVQYHFRHKYSILPLNRELLKLDIQIDKLCKTLPFFVADFEKADPVDYGIWEIEHTLNVIRSQIFYSYINFPTVLSVLTVLVSLVFALKSIFDKLFGD